MTVIDETDASYQIEPPYAQKFKEREARECIQGVLRRKLSGAAYHMDNTAAWSKEVADEIKQELKEKDWPRYKFVVHVVIGEQKGEGMEAACRCFWDCKTDVFAKECFENKSLFALATVYGVYFY